MLRIEGMWGPRSRGDGEAAALDRLVPTDSVNRASLNSNIMPGVSVFVQLSSNGRTGIFSMVISWKFAQGPGAQFAFFLLGHHFCLRLTLRTFFFLHGSLLEPGRDPVDD